MKWTKTLAGGAAIANHPNWAIKTFPDFNLIIESLKIQITSQ